MNLNFRRWFAVAATASLLGSVFADDKTKEAPVADSEKLPPLDAPEWKKLGDAGLEVWDVTEGKGDEVEMGDKVTIHYTGWTTDGKIFDSSRPRGKMNTFPLGSLIPGWQQGIPGMKPGGVRRLKIPAELGYGANGRPPKIPGGATLVFEIELKGLPPEFPDLKAENWKPLKDGSTGIRIWDLKEGTGAEVKPGDTVTIHYTGWLTNGKKFDSSHGEDNQGEPARFPLNRLIKGWQEAVPGMKVGGVRSMELPAKYAYGDQGSPPDIPGGATLVFTIEVFDVK